MRGFNRSLGYWTWLEARSGWASRVKPADAAKTYAPTIGRNLLRIEGKGLDECTEVIVCGMAAPEAEKYIRALGFEPRAVVELKIADYFLHSWGLSESTFGRTESSPTTTYLIHSNVFTWTVDPRPLFRSLKREMLRDKVSVFIVLDSQGSTPRADVELWLKAAGFELETVAEADWARLRFSERCLLAQMTDLSWVRDYADATTLFLWSSACESSLSLKHLEGLKALGRKRVVLGFDTTTVQSRGQALVDIDIREFFCDWVVEERALADGLALIDAVQASLFFLPKIERIEFFEHGSLGFKVVQARSAGLLPQELELHAHFVGNDEYERYSSEDPNRLNYSLESIKSAIKDNYVAQYVDRCIFPSSYLQNRIYEQEFGYRCSGPVTRWAPATLSPTVAVQADGLERPISEIAVVSDSEPWAASLQQTNGLLRKVEARHGLAVRWLSQSQLRGDIKARGMKTLYVLPDKNQAFAGALLEIILAECRFFCEPTGHAAEVRETAPELAPCFVTALGEALLGFFRDGTQTQWVVSAEARHVAAGRVAQVWAADNQAWMTDHARPRDISINFSMLHEDVRGEIAVAIPIYNTPPAYLDQLLSSIERSWVIPSEIILIDDGSHEDYRLALDGIFAKYQQSLALRVVRQGNRGLAGARNRGLMEAQTPFVFFVDSDDILLPHALFTAWTALKLNSNWVVTSGIYFQFEDSATNLDLPQQARMGRYEKGLGISGAKAFALVENQYISGNSMVRTEAIREAGGWDESDKATWEDYAFYTRLAWMNRDFSLIPTPLFLYRNAPGSMSKSYNRAFGRRRIVRSIPVLSKQDAAIILSLMHRGREVDLDISAFEKQLIQTKRSWMRRLRQAIAFLRGPTT